MCLFIVQNKNKRKRKRKENLYKIRKIKEKKNKIVSVQASHNKRKIYQSVRQLIQTSQKRDSVYHIKHLL